MNNDVIIGGAVVGGVIALLAALRPYILHKQGQRQVVAQAGEQNTEFWEKRFDRLDQAVTVLDRVMREQRGLTQTEIVGLRDLLVDIDTNLKVALAVRASDYRDLPRQ